MHTDRMLRNYQISLLSQISEACQKTDRLLLQRPIIINIKEETTARMVQVQSCRCFSLKTMTKKRQTNGYFLQGKPTITKYDRLSQNVPPFTPSQFLENAERIERAVLSLTD